MILCNSTLLYTIAVVLNEYLVSVIIAVLCTLIHTPYKHVHNGETESTLFSALPAYKINLGSYPLSVFISKYSWWPSTNWNKQLFNEFNPKKLYKFSNEHIVNSSKSWTRWAIFPLLQLLYLLVSVSGYILYLLLLRFKVFLGGVGGFLE